MCCNIAPVQTTEVNSIDAKDYISEEGIYVGERLKIPQSRMKAMQNRILNWKKVVSSQLTHCRYILITAQINGFLITTM